VNGTTRPAADDVEGADCVDEGVDAVPDGPDGPGTLDVPLPELRDAPADAGPDAARVPAGGVADPSGMFWP
jgi:hypothetical protein